LTVLAVAPVCVAPGVDWLGSMNSPGAQGAGVDFTGANVGLGFLGQVTHYSDGSVKSAAEQARLLGAGQSNTLWHFSPTSNPGSATSAFNNFGRSPFGSVVRQAGPIGDVLGVGLDYSGNYYGQFGGVQDGQLRVELSAERTVATSGTGILVAILGGIAIAAVCVGTAGVGCVVIGAVAVGGASYLAEDTAGDVWDSANADRVADATTTQPTPAAPPVPTVIPPITAPPAQFGPPVPYQPTITILQSAAS